MAMAKREFRRRRMGHGIYKSIHVWETHDETECDAKSASEIEPKRGPSEEEEEGGQEIRTA